MFTPAVIRLHQSFVCARISFVAMYGFNCDIRRDGAQETKLSDVALAVALCVVSNLWKFICPEL